MLQGRVGGCVLLGGGEVVKELDGLQEGVVVGAAQDGGEAVDEGHPVHGPVVDHAVKEGPRLRAQVEELGGVDGAAVLSRAPCHLDNSCSRVIRLDEE